MCTDGWWDHFEASDLEALATRSETTEHWLASMAEAIELAARPDQDNHSAVGVRLRADVGHAIDAGGPGAYPVAAATTVDLPASS